MSDVIHLKAGRVEAIIDPQGAYVDALYLEGGPELFLPRGKYETANGPKMRGGSHITYPNFGPAPEDTGLAQHGFARNEPWDVVNQTVGGVKLRHTVKQVPTDGIPPEYIGLDTKVNYCVFDQGPEFFGIEMTVIAWNLGATAMRLAPGFHPYIKVPQGVEQVNLTQTNFGNQRTDTFFLGDLATAETHRLFQAGSEIKVDLGSTALKVVSGRDMRFITTWTDTPQDSVCIEPSFGGDTFKPPHTAESVLPNSQRRVYSTCFAWQSVAA